MHGINAPRWLVEPFLEVWQVAFEVKYRLSETLKELQAKSASITNFRLVDYPNGNKHLANPHVAIEYDLHIEASPVAPAVVMAVAGGIALTIIALSIAYTVAYKPPFANGWGWVVLGVVGLGAGAYVLAQRDRRRR